jgi:hypothetical protein
MDFPAALTFDTGGCRQLDPMTVMDEVADDDQYQMSKL